MQQGGGDGKNVGHTPLWTSQLLLLGCFLVLLSGAIEQFYKPHFTELQQADENLKSLSSHYGFAPLPTKLRIRNDAAKRQADKELSKGIEWSGDDNPPVSFVASLHSAISHQAILGRIVSNDSSGCALLLPPGRAPPILAKS
ncbi:hypothetical protein HZU72_06620 [Halomonas sp. QX-2]|uniref:Uncharacterized protein n=1 Tax=Vreelandella sedimenti TaxID=2729618 RepID=A0A7Z0N5Q4_9GAMM|nr:MULTISPECIES: hypothetical protein [Halomonas]NYT72105.1 hypothetical protein [Halomonas sedimenti]